MNTFQLILLALAVGFYYLNTGIAGAYSLTGSEKKNLTGFQTSMILFLLSSTFIGLLFGKALSRLSGDIVVYIAVAMLLIVGLKMLFDSLNSKITSKVFDFTDKRIVNLFALGESINMLLVATAIGLLVENTYLAVLIIGIPLILAIVSGPLLVQSMGKESLKLRLGPIGALIIIAAAIQKLIQFLS